MWPPLYQSLEVSLTLEIATFRGTWQRLQCKSICSPGIGGTFLRQDKSSHFLLPRKASPRATPYYLRWIGIFLRHLSSRKRTLHPYLPGYCTITTAMPQTQGTQEQSSSNNSSETKTTKQMSQYQMVKAAGFRNFPEFLLSYGLKIHSPEDVEEGKAILKALFEHDT